MLDEAHVLQRAQDSVDRSPSAARARPPGRRRPAGASARTAGAGSRRRARSTGCSWATGGRCASKDGLDCG